MNKVVTARFHKNVDRVVVGVEDMTGELVKENTHTIWMRLSDGKIVNRKKSKHQVVIS